MNARRAVAAGALAAALIAVSLAVAYRVRLNTSASMPRGLWRTEPLRAMPARGAVVVVCPPMAAAAMAVQRAYLGPGDCAGGSEPLLKPVGAVPGDVVVVEPHQVVVNDGPPMPLLDADAAGRPLPRLAPGVYVVREGELWLFSALSRRSWDGRYFGPVPLPAVRGAAAPLLVVD